MGLKQNEVPDSVEEAIVRALNELGSLQWPSTYEVQKLSRVIWCVQSRNFIEPPFGRYEVTVSFVMQKPSHFEIVHSNGNNGIALTKTHEMNYNVLTETLLEAFQFGPRPLDIPLH